MSTIDYTDSCFACPYFENKMLIPKDHLKRAEYHLKESSARECAQKTIDLTMGLIQVSIIEAFTNKTGKSDLLRMIAEFEAEIARLRTEFKHSNFDTHEMLATTLKYYAEFMSSTPASQSQVSEPACS